MKYLSKVDAFSKKLGNIIPEWAIALTARLAIFVVFWKSVQTKIDGLTVAGQHFAFYNVTDTTIALFEYEYDLPLLAPSLAAYLATFAEFFFALGLLFGLLTRLSALGLLLVTIVIQIFVYWDAWPTHLLWAAPLIYLLRHGAGSISLDHIVK